MRQGTETVSRRHDATLHEGVRPRSGTWRHGVLQRFVRVLRRIVGAPDYQAYLEHCRTAGHPPLTRDNGIVINVPQRILYYFAQGSLVAHYPIGLGRPNWRTPTGTFHVRIKAENPVWHVPRSIQEEMRRTGQDIKTQVPPGPENPLGQYWLGLSRFDCGIHGTNAPASIYQFQTHGCIRLHPEDIAQLFPQVGVGTEVEILYEPVLLARTADGIIFLEVHPDVYRRGKQPRRIVEAVAAASGLGPNLDWQRVERVIREGDGVPREVTGCSASERSQQPGHIPRRPAQRAPGLEAARAFAFPR